MKSLFLKIYFWFCVAIVLVGVAFTSTLLAGLPAPLAIRWRERTGSALRLYAQAGVEVLEREGREQANSYLKRLEGPPIIRTALVDGNNQEVTGRILAAGARELAVK